MNLFIQVFFPEIALELHSPLHHSTDYEFLLVMSKMRNSMHQPKNNVIPQLDLNLVSMLVDLLLLEEPYMVFVAQVPDGVITWLLHFDHSVSKVVLLI
jgi:hypothetical protein